MPAMVQRLRPEGIISALLTNTIARGNKENIESLSGKLLNLEKEGIEIDHLSIRRVPGGFYSEDVERFIGNMLTFGYADQRSPINIKEKGIELCKEIIDEELRENPKQMKKLIEIIKVKNL